MDGISDIESEQARKKELADILNQARDYKSAGCHLNDAGIPSGIDDQFVQKCKDLGISIPHYAKYSDGKDKLDAKWDIAIAQLQTKMVQLQDLMGQYNSYTSGANTAIAKSNDILSGLARGQ